ncbi:MAG TPA: citrate/2-methylcitrate synthase [Bacillota bacterium]|nr:citrate/2-methylcitrate synthase [Bacillota bacterium]
MTEKQFEEKIDALLGHIEVQEQKEHYARLISTLLEKGYFPGLAEVPIVKSSISHIDGDRGILTYRGYPVEELAEFCSFEEVCYLVLKGDLPMESEKTELSDQLLANKDLPEDVAEAVAKFNPNIHPMNMLSAAVLLLEADDKGSNVVSNYKENINRAICLIAKFPTIIGTFLTKNPHFNHGQAFTSFAHYILFCFNPQAAKNMENVKLFEESLILHMDHTMNNSTFSARAVGSSEAGIYGLISSAINSLSGPLHGGANERVVKTLELIGGPDRVAGTLEDSLEHHQKIMGVGHRIYKTYDPRARYFKNRILPKIFQERSEYLQNEEPGLWNLYMTAVALERQVQERLGKKKLYPNVDFWSGLFYRAMGVEKEFFTTIFAVARVVGWCAHWLEQRESDGKIYRPYQLYVGFDVRHIVR